MQNRAECVEFFQALLNPENPSGETDAATAMIAIARETCWRRNQACGEKRDERGVDDRDVRLVERVFGQFRRAIQLPFSPNPDQIDATFRDGVLTITVPKNAEQRNKQRQIEVKRDSGQAGSRSRSDQGSSQGTGQTSTEGGRQQQGDERAGAQRETADTAA